MELKQYFQIVWKRAWIVIALTALTLVGSLAWSWQHRPAPLFHASLTLVANVTPAAAESSLADPAYYAYLISEYMMDDFAEIVKGQKFGASVAQRLPADVPIPAATIPSAITTSAQHRVLQVTVSRGDAHEAEVLARAIANTLENTDLQEYFAQLQGRQAHFVVVNGPVVSPAGTSLRAQLDVPIRVALAFFAGVALAFLLDYLDDTIRDAAELELLGWQIVGEIPERRRLRLGR